MSWADLRAALPGLRGQRVHVIAASREAEVRAALTGLGFEIHTLVGSAITNDAAFFQEAARGLGLPPWFGANWDAFLDSIGDFASAVPARKAVLWIDADQTLAHDLQTVLAAVDAFAAAALGAGEDDTEPRQLEVFLLGAGGGFGE